MFGLILGKRGSTLPCLRKNQHDNCQHRCAKYKKAKQRSCKLAGPSATLDFHRDAAASDLKHARPDVKDTTRASAERSAECGVHHAFCLAARRWRRWREAAYQVDRARVSEGLQLYRRPVIVDKPSSGSPILAAVKKPLHHQYLISITTSSGEHDVSLSRAPGCDPGVTLFSKRS